MSDPNPESRRVFDRRRFLVTGGLAAAGTLAFGSASRRLSAREPARASPPRFSMQPLKYAFDALEPHIDAKTMEIHHGRHYAGYVNNLNRLIEDASFRGPESLRELVSDLGSVPRKVREAVRNNGGGAYNHEIFWRVMSPDGGGEPPAALAEAMARDFGSLDRFRSAFAAAATGEFGSGWAWLCTGRDGSLSITATPNQDNPVMRGVVETTGTPIFGLDVWEHAYYLKYQNRRADYIGAFWNIVDWAAVERFYREAHAG